MNWFYDTFLPSLLERAGTNKGMWLSRKQTAICIEKMEQHTTMVPQFQGDYCRHNYYTMEWNGRHVFLNYSKLNGCGQITFRFNAAEAEEASRRRAEEERREAEERMERKRKWTAWARENAPERLAQRKRLRKFWRIYARRRRRATLNILRLIVRRWSGPKRSWRRLKLCWRFICKYWPGMKNPRHFLCLLVSKNAGLSCKYSRNQNNGGIQNEKSVSRLPLHQNQKNRRRW